MRVLQRASELGVTADVIVGTGLIGDAVANAASLLPGVLSDVCVPTDWSDLSRSLELAATGFRSSLPRPRRLRLFWCAGKAGFGSSGGQCEAELGSFETVLRWAVELAADFVIEFHLTSSAGGLHEGQMLVSTPSSARTTRPYAQLKLDQERALHASSLTARFVYRLSSVYGLPLAGRRQGLVSTMVVNAFRHRLTLITAHASTQRDFVAASDVGTFMATEGKPLTSALHEGVHYLVQGRPTSIFALQQALERLLFRRVAVTYSKGKDNFESTTFSPRIRPPLWSTRTVESILPRIVATVQGQGVEAPHPALRRAQDRPLPAFAGRGFTY